MVNNKYFLGRSLRFIVLLSVVVAICYAIFSTHLFAHILAPAISPPIISWDSAGDTSPPGPVNGITTFTPGSTAGTGVLLMVGSIVSFIEKKIPAPLIVGGTVSIYASLESVTAIDGVLHADFGTMIGSGFINPNPTGYDVEVLDSNGALALGGNLESLTINGIIGVRVGSGGAIFSALDGYLKSDFRPGTAGIVHLEFNAVPSWSEASYDNPWSSESKGDIGHSKPKKKRSLGALHKIIAHPYPQKENVLEERSK